MIMSDYSLTPYAVTTNLKDRKDAYVLCSITTLCLWVSVRKY